MLKEEARIIAREEKMGSEDQALTVQSKKSRTGHHKGKHSHQNKTLENLAKICLSTFAIHVMKEDTLQEIVLETKIDLTRGRETRKGIVLMLQKMMSLPRRESNKIVVILQVMKNMF